MTTVASPEWDVGQAVLDRTKAQYNKDNVMLFSQLPTHSRAETTGVPYVRDAVVPLYWWDNLWNMTPWGGPDKAGKSPESTPENPAKGVSVTLSDALPILLAAGAGFFILKRFI